MTSIRHLLDPVRGTGLWPVHHNHNMVCSVMTDDVSLRRSRRVNESIVLCYSVLEKTSFHAKFQVYYSHGLPVVT